MTQWKVGSQADDARLLATAQLFVVNTFLGHGRWARQEAPTLDAARKLRDDLGTDDQGRRALIYAVVAGGTRTIFVE